MNLKFLMAGFFLLVVSVSNVVYADHVSSYYPPERISCQLNGYDKLYCGEINRRYLVEDMTTANLEHGRDNVFYFVSAAAYVTPNNTEARVFFTYKDSQSKLVKLRTLTTSIWPDLKHGNWKKINDDIYVCDTGYMNCLVTNHHHIS